MFYKDKSFEYFQAGGEKSEVVFLHKGFNYWIFL